MRNFYINDILPKKKNERSERNYALKETEYKNTRGNKDITNVHLLFFKTVIFLSNNNFRSFFSPNLS